MGPQELPIVGEWKLYRFKSKKPDGSVEYPFGEQAQGSLIYTASRRFSVQVQRPDRPRIASGQRGSGTVAEIRQNYLGYVAYYGSYDLHVEDGYITHAVEGSLFPNWEGQLQKRFYGISEGRLTLTSPLLVSSLDGHEVTYEVLWDRIGST